MITQKVISARISKDTIFQLECEARNGYKKNRIINNALRMYLDAMDVARYYRQNGNNKELQLFAERWIPLAVLRP